jgi:1-acyl-sn-glycerol-3-phosphate acyltransferase
MITLRGRFRPLFCLAEFVLRQFYRPHRVIGTEYVAPDTPAIFVSNHLDTYAPIALSLFFPFPFRPWVHASLLDPKLCRPYLEKNFTRKSLKLAPPWSTWLAACLAPPVVRLMRTIGAIPVWRGQMKLRETVQLSCQALRQGENLLIFPENPDEPLTEHLHDFYGGFVHLAHAFYRQSGQSLNFYPIYVDVSRRLIEIGQPVAYPQDANTPRPYDGMISCLKNRMLAMERGLQSAANAGSSE